MTTDPLPDDRPRVRLPPGWPEEAPPYFFVRERPSKIVVFVDRMGELVRRFGRSVRERRRSVGSSTPPND